MNFYPIYRNKKLLPWIKWWLIKGNKVMPKHLSEWINSASAITLTGVYKGSPLLNLNLNGNTSQTGTPTPEAPVPVNVVKGNNTIKINDTDYHINLKSKNLFDKSGNILSMTIGTNIVGETTTFAKATYQKHVYCQCKPNTTYTVTKGTSINTILGLYESAETPAVGVTCTVLYWNSYNEGTATVTTGNSANYLDIRITTNNTSEEDIQTILDSIQVEEGESPTTYEPYYDYELCKIGDYQDVIYKQNNKWYVEKYIEKIVLNGSESSWLFNTEGTFGNIPYIRYSDVGIDNLIKKGTGTIESPRIPRICDYFIYYDTPSSFKNCPVGGLGFNTSGSNDIFFIFCVSSDSIADVNAWKTWLSTHNTTVYYVLAESTTTEITETTLISQLEAIYNARLQSGTNTITQTPSDLPFYLNFQYYEKG